MVWAKSSLSDSHARCWLLTINSGTGMLTWVRCRAWALSHFIFHGASMELGIGVSLQNSYFLGRYFPSIRLRFAFLRRENQGKGLFDGISGVFFLRAAYKAVQLSAFRNSPRGAFPEDLKEAEGDPESYKVSDENATTGKMAVSSQRASINLETIWARAWDRGIVELPKQKTH